MKYDVKSGKITITCREFVSDARRGICTGMPYDDDEPKLDEPSARRISNIFGETDKVSYEYEFEIEKYSFVINIDSTLDKDGALCLSLQTSSPKATPKKEEIAQLRAEGFVTALAHLTKHKVDKVKLRLLYINPERDAYSISEEWVGLRKTQTFVDRCKATVAVYAKPEVERATERLPALARLKFPYAKIREGQSEFIKKVYKTIARGGVLYATAPTGTGKTVSALFPALRALGEGRCDKIFYLTPKGTTAEAAISCIKLLSESGASVRAILHGAKDKSCINGGICKEGKKLCPTSRANKLSDAALTLYNLNLTVVTPDEIVNVARQYTVCPYELSLSYAELCDVVICDFNYLFDTDIYIRRFFSKGGRYAFLIDEAHNLPNRARDMYSCEISEEELTAPAFSDLLGEFSNAKNAARVLSKRFYEMLFPLLKDDIRKDEFGDDCAAIHTKQIPIGLFSALDEMICTCEEEIILNYSAKDEEKDIRIKYLTDYVRKVKKLRAVMDMFDNEYEMFVFLKNNKLSVKLFCIDTGKAIAKCLEKGHAAIFFSATLTPLYYYKSMLGGDRTSDTLELPSPFDPECLAVRMMDKVSTRYNERADTLMAVYRVIAATVSAKRGKYMIFAPSFAYCEALANVFSTKHPKIKVLVQKRNFTKKQKEDFLKEFEKEDHTYLIGFCVTGGIYSEGIDLVGNSLIGAVVVGIGMPPITYENEAICAYYDEKYEEGKQFAYIYPGMNKVLQAAGRVIRREDDRGVIVLIDDRFADPVYKKIMPTLWRGMKFVATANDLKSELDEFWQSV